VLTATEAVLGSEFTGQVFFDCFGRRQRGGHKHGLDPLLVQGLRGPPAHSATQHGPTVLQRFDNRSVSVMMIVVVFLAFLALAPSVSGKRIVADRLPEDRPACDLKY
jgi:hypothetical protein